MNVQAAAGAVSALFDGGTGSRERSGRWVLLYGRKPRSLLVPTHKLAVQRRCVRTFRRGLGALAGELALLLDRIAPGLALPQPFDGPDAARASWLADLNGLASAAVQMGTPGPYQKASVLLLDTDGNALGLAKVAMGERADRMVQREAFWLRWLRDTRVSDSRVPRLLAEGRTGAGRRFLATDLGPEGSNGSGFTGPQQSFLAALGRASARHGTFEGSRARRRLRVAHARLRARVDPEVGELLESGYRDCERLLRGWSGPFVVAHGDFAPWNTRRGVWGSYVFDWEYAWDGASPAYDALHWHLLPRALGRGGLSSQTIQSARASTGAYLQAAFPEHRWTEKVLNGLVVHYLLDVVLFYGMADGSINVQHPVIRNYLQVLERRSQWMA